MPSFARDGPRVSGSYFARERTHWPRAVPRTYLADVLAAGVGRYGANKATTLERRRSGGCNETHVFVQEVDGGLGLSRRHADGADLLS